MDWIETNLILIKFEIYKDVICICVRELHEIKHKRFLISGISFAHCANNLPSEDQSLINYK